MRKNSRWWSAPTTVGGWSPSESRFVGAVASVAIGTRRSPPPLRRRGAAGGSAHCVGAGGRRRGDARRICPRHARRSVNASAFTAKSSAFREKEGRCHGLAFPRKPLMRLSKSSKIWDTRSGCLGPGSAASCVGFRSENPVRRTQKLGHEQGLSRPSLSAEALETEEESGRILGQPSRPYLVLERRAGAA